MGIDNRGFCHSRRQHAFQIECEIVELSDLPIIRFWHSVVFSILVFVHCCLAVWETPQEVGEDVLSGILL